MTKKDHVLKAAEDTGIDQHSVSRVIEAFVGNIKKAAADGEETFFRGFGTFGIKQRKAKKGQNISKGTTIDIPAKNVLSFKPSTELKVFQGNIKG